MNTSLLIRIAIVLGFYFFLRYFGGWIGEIVLYPITLLVTYLHEFGHAFAALISGGKPLSVQVNRDGSGLTTTQGGWENLILMGGYLGSIIFGNVMLAVSVRHPRVSKFLLKLLAVSMAVTAVVWHSTFETSGMLIAFAAIIYYVCEKTVHHSEILMLLGILCIAYILQDFRVGPSSDIQKFASNTFINSPTVWMFIWAIIALLITFFNVKFFIWQKNNVNEPVTDVTNNK
jgi:Peptidase M50B-like